VSHDTSQWRHHNVDLRGALVLSHLDGSPGEEQPVGRVRRVQVVLQQGGPVGGVDQQHVVQCPAGLVALVPPRRGPLGPAQAHAFRPRAVRQGHHVHRGAAVGRRAARGPNRKSYHGYSHARWLVRLSVFGFLPIFTEKYPDFFKGADRFKLIFTRIVCFHGCKICSCSCEIRAKWGENANKLLITQQIRFTWSG